MVASYCSLVVKTENIFIDEFCASCQCTLLVLLHLFWFLPTHFADLCDYLPGFCRCVLGNEVFLAMVAGRVKMVVCCVATPSLTVVLGSVAVTAVGC